jgi:hypothetical protein
MRCIVERALKMKVEMRCMRRGQVTSLPSSDGKKKNIEKYLSEETF